MALYEEEGWGDEFESPTREAGSKGGRGWIKVVILVLIIFVIILGVYYYFKHKQSTPDTPETPQAGENLDLAMLPTYEGELFPIRMLNSDQLMYIEGLSQADAENIDACLRHFEEAGDDAAENAGDLEWIYNQLEPRLEDWFNPNFDLVSQFVATEHTTEGDGTVAWLSVPMYEQLQKMSEEDIAQVFYFREDEALGGYRMSQCYYLIGLSGAYEWLQQLTWFE